MKLSVLICTIPEREVMFNHLKEELERQVAELGLENHIEILSDPTPKGEMLVGAKRNVLKAKASGEYICYMDDDDYPSLTYLRRIFEVIHRDYDIITFNMNYFVNGKFRKKYIINRWQGEVETPNEYIIDRIFYHLCPHKKSISEKVLFAKKNFQEDADYSYEIKPLLKTEFHIDEPIYNYYFDEQASATRN